MTQKTTKAEDAKSKFDIKNIFGQILKLTGSAVLLYALYFLYVISEFSFVAGVENSFKQSSSQTVISRFDVQQSSTNVSGIPKTVVKLCKVPIVLNEYKLKESEDIDDMEVITVSGSRSSIEEYMPETDYLETLKALATKVVQKERSAFIGSYGAKIQIDGFYVLRPKPGGSGKTWHLVVGSNCLRVTRYYQEAGTLVMAADYVFQFQFAKSANVLKLSPIYISIDSAFAKSSIDSVNLQVEINAQWLSDNYNETQTLSVSDNMIMKDVNLGQPNTIDFDSMTNKNLSSQSLLRLANWIIAPVHAEYDKEQCIKNNTVCYFVAANLNFKFTEVGLGNGAVDKVGEILTGQ